MKSRKFIVSVVVLLVYMGTIFFLSSLPGDLLKPEREYGFDIDQSIKHLAEFSILGVLMANIFWQLTKDITLSRGFMTFSSSSAFSTLYGVLDEIHQYFVPTRYCTTFDMLANMVGSITGVFIFLTYIRLVRAKDRKVLH